MFTRCGILAVVVVFCAPRSRADDPAPVTVDIELSPPVFEGSLSRCICFFATDCCGQEFEVCQVVAFDGGFAEEVIVNLPHDDFLCLEAVDPLHTLPAISYITEDESGRFAQFLGDPSAGGNWLVGGDLTGDGAINILDIGEFLKVLAAGATVFANGNTTCVTSAPHGDVTGDGLVNDIDYAVIAELNWLKKQHDFCCTGLSTEDSDGDGTKDLCDKCADDPTKVEPGPCGCGDSDTTDTDGDGIPDCTDVCPGVDDAVFAPECAGTVPTIGGWGLLITTLLLLTGGKLGFPSRRAAGVRIG